MQSKSFHGIEMYPTLSAMLIQWQVDDSTPMGEVNFTFVQRIDKDPRTEGIEKCMTILIDSNLRQAVVIDGNDWAVEQRVAKITYSSLFTIFRNKVIPWNPNLIRSRTPFEFQDSFSPLK